MKQLIPLLALGLCTQPVLAQTRAARRPATPPPAVSSQTASRQNLPLKKVILYSNGVAYFERRGKVSGRAEIALDFKQSQVDDVLKSMVVLDLGKGRIEAVSYNTSLPTAARLSEVPFSVEAAQGGGMLGILRQLQGARVFISTGQRSATGAVLNVEERVVTAEKDKTPVSIRTVVISGDNGELSTFDLADVTSLKLLDGDTQKDIRTFADAKSAERRKESKTIVVKTDGTGERELVVSYTLAAPIWKTTYRVVLDKSGRPFFQGWAIVDNVSEEDWKDVSLSFVSGNPSSFIQPLQQPLFKYREVKQLQGDVRLLPQGSKTKGGQGVQFSGGVKGGGSPGASDEVAEVSGGGNASINASVGSLATTVNQRSVNSLSQNGGANVAGNGPAFRRGEYGGDGDLSSAIRGGDTGVSTAAEGAEVGDLFEYRVAQPVTVERNQSALIPILQEQMDGERVSLFNKDVDETRPMFGVRMLNTSNLTLENGPLTVLDGDAYVGESQLERFKPAERRFVTFGIDLGTQVKVKEKEVMEPVSFIKCVNGSIQARYFTAQKTTYTVTNQTDKPRTIYIEHPVDDEWKLSDETEKPASEAEGVVRFRRELKPRETVEIPVIERKASTDNFNLIELTRADLEVFVNRKYVDPAQLPIFEKILEMNSRLQKIGAEKESAEKEIETIEADQKRLRENINSLGGKPEAKPLLLRYVAKVDAQETRIEQLRKSIADGAAESERIEKERSELLKQLAFEKKL
jgi:hypothetical protein